MRQKSIFFALLFTLGFCLADLEHSVVNAQSKIVATAKLNSRPTEAQTLKQGIAQRHVGESDNSFLGRVLPVSYPCTYANPCDYDSHLVSYSWRPTPFGKQLFFANPHGGDEGYDLILFVLDPFQANTYAVQAFNMGHMGDLTVMKAVFFADVDQDGQKEMLALNECDLKEGFKDDNGEIVYGRTAHYETFVFKYTGLDATGRPRYREDRTPRPYMNELPTASSIRQALTKHQQKPMKRKPL